MYTLEKMQLLHGAYSAVRAGAEVSSKHLKMFNRDSDDVTDVENLDQIAVGQELLLYRNYSDFIKTSPIAEILDQSENSVKFKTQTSIYELRKEEVNT